MAMLMCDTSSAIEMSRKGECSEKLYVTPGIKVEIDRHRDVYKAGKLEVSEKVYGSVKEVDSSARPDFDKVRYDAHWAWLEGCSRKKVDIDPMSPQDLNLVAEAIIQARKGRAVEVFTEDEHISGTISRMLEKAGYSHLSRNIKVRSVAA